MPSAMPNRSSRILYVMFRVYPAGKTFAIFPEEPTEETGTLSLCYCGGKFSGGMYGEIVPRSRAALEDEAAALAAELETKFGYTLCKLSKARNGYAGIRLQRARRDAQAYDQKSCDLLNDLQAEKEKG